MRSRLTWVLRAAAATGSVALAVALTSSAVASQRPGTSSVPGFSTGLTKSTGSSFNWTNAERAEMAARMFVHAPEGVGSPFLPPGHGGAIPGQPGGRPAGGNPDPGTPPGQPDDRPPGHANDDKDKDKDKD